MSEKKPKKKLEFPLPSAAEMIRFAIEVCQEYRAEGDDLTARGLYYQGVTRKFLPSDQRSYDKLIDDLSDARKAGTFPLWALVDRTRESREGAVTRNDANIRRALTRSAAAAAKSPETYLHRDRWFGQPVHVSVWFEKEALAGVFQSVCEKLGVTWVSVRGDPSHGLLYQWLEQAALAHGVDNPDGWTDTRSRDHHKGDHHKGLAKRSVVLYFGDHDPTGIRIPRTAEETIRIFMGHMNLTFPVEFQRVGITLEQARERNLPPFWAKVSANGDYANYIEEFGTTEAWELDALSPKELRIMVEQSVSQHFDEALWQKLQGDIERRRAEMRSLMTTAEWHTSATDFGGVE